MKPFFLILALTLLPQAHAENAPDPFAGVPANVMEYHRSTNGSVCEYDAENIWEPALAIDAGKGWKVYAVPCVQGAYQASFAVYSTQDGSAMVSRLYFVDFDSRAGVVGTPSVGRAFFRS